MSGELDFDGVGGHACPITGITVAENKMKHIKSHNDQLPRSELIAQHPPISSPPPLKSPRPHHFSHPAGFNLSRLTEYNWLVIYRT